MSDDTLDTPLFRVGETVTRREYLARLDSTRVVSSVQESIMGSDRTVVRHDATTGAISLTGPLGDVVVAEGRRWVRLPGGEWEPADESDRRIQALSNIASGYADAMAEGTDDVAARNEDEPATDAERDPDLDERTLTVVGTEQRHGRLAYVLTGTLDADHGRMVFTHVVSDEGVLFETGSETDDDPNLSLRMRYTEWDVPQCIEPPA